MDAPTDPKEAALLITLNPGMYTGVITGKNGSEGVGMSETYLFK
jgi:hypothetical protein